MKRVFVFYPGTVPTPCNLTETPQVGSWIHKGGCSWIVKDVIWNIDEGLIKIQLVAKQ